MIETFFYSIIFCSNRMSNHSKSNGAINVLDFYNHRKISRYNKRIYLKVPVRIFYSQVMKNMKCVFWEEANNIIKRLFSNKSSSEISCLFFDDRFVFMMRGYAPVECFCLEDVCRDIAWFYNQKNTTFPLLF